MAIAKGVSLGPYEILSLIGEGGMGQVWRGRDRRIGRDVAVKVLTESFGAGEQAVLRFEQEARAAGALNHPGLVTIFDVGTADGAPYIVMELLEGETLRDAIGDADPVPLPLLKAIDYAIQISSALAVAHEKGIIHRDLKPENLFITTDGRVKILDFGLAKLAADAPSVDGSPGFTRHLTTAGIAIGTPAYMSPEQVRALPLDHRTDIFSLGSVFFEILCGRPAFDGLSAIETMNAVLNVAPPSLNALDPDIPPGLDAIVRHCLEKNPRERFQSTRDLAFQLRTLGGVQNTVTHVRAPALSAPLPLPLTGKRRLPRRTIAIAAATIALLLAGVAIGFALFHGRGGPALAGPRTFRQLTFGDGPETFPTLAPDGKSFAYVSSQSGNRDIYVQRVDGRAAINITSDSPDDDSEPAFSPDGDRIAFRSERDGGGIFVMGVTGESVRRLTDIGHNPSWSPDGNRIAVSTVAVGLKPHVHPERGELWIVDTRTGAKRVVHALRGGSGAAGDSDALQPTWSPHGKRLAFWGFSSGRAQSDIWTIDPDAPRPDATAVRVTSDPALHWNPAWSPDGQYLYFGSNRDGTLNLWRVAMEEASGKTAGAQEPLSLPGAISGNFAFSQQGEMAFAAVSRFYRLLALPFDAASGRTGAPRPLFGGSQEILSFEPAPDGRSIAFTTAGAQEDLFIANADGTRMRQLTNDAARDRNATWAPDGKTLYFYSNRDGVYRVWSIRADGSGLTRITDDRDLAQIGTKNVYTPSVSPDGRTLLVQTERSQVLIHLDRPIPGRLEVIPPGLGLERWSPDGQQIVGAVRDGGLFVYSLRTRRSEKVLSRRVTSPRWLPDGRNIVFFERQQIGILDLDTRRETTAPFLPPPGKESGYSPGILSRDGSTLYVRQTLEQGDVWLVRLGKE
jgi:eukaryotic-like serine/threonine-protein kinase